MPLITDPAAPRRPEDPSGPAPRCEVWWARPADQHEGLLSLLQDVELERRSAYRRPEDRARFTVGAALIRLTAARLLDCDPVDLRIVRDCPDCRLPHGRPRVEHRDLELAVSHSADLVMIGLSTSAPMGVDVEKIDPAKSRKLARRVLSVTELAKFQTLTDDERTRMFFQAWTRKEAVLKSTGDGLRMPMNAVDFDEQGRLLAYPGRPDLAGNACVIDLTPRAEGYRAALAILRPPPAEVVHYDAQGLLRSW
ncbi:4'-phosphopantetheinyl transferase family protein [Streptosporangium pseudovulgare]|uniref:4'-phosphopantetheinyl transferase n=1 Tax=Streptosporangium pseudovulgare TaxID=35765 RepID=A0ABQ2RAG9_9ACTN|nr:4'-phosphopantetheinyl transferase superfamily protein [Streptosporangium pseudovulgare]GGQ19311.1 4'-phosphopantetheinyl transferase [Streptosporangium pseudovulgare]